MNEVEDFITDLIIYNNCKSFFITEEGNIWYENIEFPLQEMTKLQYFPSINSMRIDTDLEYCMIDFDIDNIVCYDKEVD